MDNNVDSWPVEDSSSSPIQNGKPFENEKHNYIKCIILSLVFMTLFTTLFYNKYFNNFSYKIVLIQLKTWLLKFIPLCINKVIIKVMKT